MHIRPVTDLSVEPASVTAALNEKHLRVVIDACRADTPEQRKRLVTALYEACLLSAEETAVLFDRLGLAEA